MGQRDCLVTSYPISSVGVNNGVVLGSAAVGALWYQVLLQDSERLMPKVGKKKFAYTKKGKAAAKRHAKKTGKKVKSAY